MKGKKHWLTTAAEKRKEYIPNSDAVVYTVFMNQFDFFFLKVVIVVNFFYRRQIPRRDNKKNSVFVCPLVLSDFPILSQAVGFLLKFGSLS